MIPRASQRDLSYYYYYYLYLATFQFAVFQILKHLHLSTTAYLYCYKLLPRLHVYSTGGGSVSCSCHEDFFCTSESCFNIVVFLVKLMPLSFLESYWLGVLCLLFWSRLFASFLSVLRISRVCIGVVPVLM